MVENLSEDVAELVKGSPLFHFEYSARILDKENKLIRPVANVYQQRLAEVYEVIQRLTDEGLWDRGVRCLGLKPRQVGSSTFCSFILHHHMMRYPSNGITMANLARVSHKVFGRYQEHYDNDLCDAMGHVPSSVFGVTGMKTSGSVQRYTNGSFHEIDTAEQPRGSIGTTRQVALLSEVGRYPRTQGKMDSRTIQALLASVSNTPRSVVYGESTPEGAGSWFHTQWQEAITLDEFLGFIEQGLVPGVDPGTGNGWIKVFVGWFEFPEHRVELSEVQKARMEETLTTHERFLQVKYGCDLEQLGWRRVTLQEECGADVNLLNQDYPEDEVSCFLVAGRPRFNIPALRTMREQSKGYQPVHGVLQVADADEVPVLVPTELNEAEVTIYEEPRIGCRYLVSCDPATGEQADGINPDRTSVLVLRDSYVDGVLMDERPPKVVARVVPPYGGDADQTVDLIDGLSKYYGRCVSCVEVNMGLEVVRLLQMRDVPQYRRSVFNPENPSKRDFKLGFKLKDAQLKRALIEQLASAIREGSIEVPDDHIIDELFNFVTTDKGKLEAREGMKDDDVICLAMAMYARPQATRYREQVRKRRKPKDYYQWTRPGDPDFVS